MSRVRRRVRTGKRVAVVGSGPAGLAAADQLNRAGHLVTVFERADRIGGLLRYGIPEFKLEKRCLDRRLDLMQEEGVMFRTSATSAWTCPPTTCRANFDAVVLAGGSTDAARSDGARPRAGRHPLRDGLPAAAEPALRRRRDRRRSSSSPPRTSTSSSSAAATRAPTAWARRIGRAPQRCTQLELLPRPPDARAASNPWPLWPNIFRVSSAHEEGGERLYSISTTRFTGDEQRPGHDAARHERRDRAR